MARVFGVPCPDCGEVEAGTFARLRSSESGRAKSVRKRPVPIEAWTSKFLKRLEVLIPKYNGSGGADLASFQETSNEQQFLDFSH